MVTLLLKLTQSVKHKSLLLGYQLSWSLSIIYINRIREEKGFKSAGRYNIISEMGVVFKRYDRQCGMSWRFVSCCTCMWYFMTIRYLIITLIIYPATQNTTVLLQTNATARLFCFTLHSHRSFASCYFIIRFTHRTWERHEQKKTKFVLKFLTRLCLQILEFWTFNSFNRVTTRQLTIFLV